MKVRKEKWKVVVAYSCRVGERENFLKSDVVRNGKLVTKIKVLSA